MKVFTKIAFSILIVLLLVYLLNIKYKFYNFPFNDHLNNYEVTILIRSPKSDCVQLIKFDSNGTGNTTRGTTDVYFMDAFTTFKNISYEDKFIINNEKDLKLLSQYINEIDTAKVIVGSMHNDARRVQMYIQGVLKIDTYNEYENKTSMIMQLLYSYLPYNSDLLCW